MTDPKIILGTTNIKKLDLLAKKKPQSILIYSKRGLGVNIASSYYAKKIKGIVNNIYPTDIDGNTDIKRGTIKISQIRDLIKHSQNFSKENVITIINYADKMQESAQNSFLKLLEEPIENHYIVLTSENKGALLNTILSRVQEIELKSPSKLEFDKLFDIEKTKDEKKNQQIKFIANNRPYKLIELKDEDNLNHNLEIFMDARKFINEITLDYFKLIKKYSEKKEDLLELLDAILIILNSLMIKKPSRELSDKILLCIDVIKKIENQKNAKIQLLRLMI